MVKACAQRAGVEIIYLSRVSFREVSLLLQFLHTSLRLITVYFTRHISVSLYRES